MTKNIGIYQKVKYVGETPIDHVKNGDCGYTIEDYGDGNFEVEFSRPDGTTFAQVVISGNLLAPHNRSNANAR